MEVKLYRVIGKFSGMVRMDLEKNKKTNSKFDGLFTCNTVITLRIFIRICE